MNRECFYLTKPLKKDYHIKFVSDNFLYGNYKPYEEKIDKYFSLKRNESLEFIKDKIDDIIPDFKSIILEKNTRKVIGCMGILNDSNIEEDRYKLLLCTTTKLSIIDVKEIMNAFKEFSKKTLNLNNLEEYFICNDGKIKSSKINNKKEDIIDKYDFIEGITDELYDLYREYYGNIPKMFKPVTIAYNNKIIGIMGITNFIFSNRRGTANIFLDKNIDDEFSVYLGRKYLDKYIDYLHSSGLKNIGFNVSGSDDIGMKIAKNSDMEFYGAREFGSNYKDKTETLYLFQHIPNMKKKNNLYIPDNKVFDGKLEKQEKTKILPVGKMYKLVDPSLFVGKHGYNGIFENIVDINFIKSMTDRVNFTIPLGEDKYFIDEDLLVKRLQDYDYVLIDLYNSFAGFANILRENENSTACDIEIAISPVHQNEGIGTLMTKVYINELLRRGYLSIGANCFDFNHKSNSIFKNIGDFYGTRIDSYYINGKYHNINNYNVTINDKEKILKMDYKKVDK